MFKRIFFLVFSLFFLRFLSGVEPPSLTPPPLKIVSKELQQAETDFEIAKKMFNPWYGGPLFTGSGNVLDPGLVNVQPYLYVIDNYASYDSSGHSRSMPDLVVVNPVLSLQLGLVKRLDTTLTVQCIYQTQEDQSTGNLGDTSLFFGFAVLEESPYVPAVKFSFKETFPSGKYQNLDPDQPGIEATGGGSYQSTIGINLSKVAWWHLTHPMQFRLSLNYTFPAASKVHGFNAYGGGQDTEGIVKPGNYFSGGFGYELSFTQKLVFAIDLSYEYHSKTTFEGENGCTNCRIPASNTRPLNDVLSLAPALEYNFNSNLALIGGAWFSVWGRNSSNFAGGIITFTYTF